MPRPVVEIEDAKPGTRAVGRRSTLVRALRTQGTQAANPGLSLLYGRKKIVLSRTLSEEVVNLIPVVISLFPRSGKSGLAERRLSRKALAVARKKKAEAELESALIEARARGARQVARILDGKDMLSTKHFAELIGVTPEAVRQKREKHEILGLKGARRDFRYPDWQIDENGQVLPRLPRIFEILGGEPWTVYRFLLQHHSEIDGETALRALRRGNIQGTLAAAENSTRAFS